jgi:stearoyl-CoA desaturase (delta-9 desaturase)
VTNPTALLSQEHASQAGAHNPAPPRVSFGMKVAILIGVMLPFAGFVAAFVLLWGRGFSWVQLALLLGMYVLSALGITVGFHRLFTHKSFETNRVVQCILAVLGSMAAQGPLLKWVACHRQHHQYSDQHDDPHSPHHYGAGILGVLKGLWHAHMGWLFLPDSPKLYSYVQDLRKSRLLRTISALFPIWVAVGLLVPTVLGFLFLGGWMGAVLGLVWGGLARIFLVHHVTWSINSVCHVWGGQPFAAHDHSRNNIVFGILALGEGWHNNHHAFPSSARHGLAWWQVDASYLFIRLLASLGLAWSVRVAPEPAIASKRKRWLGPKGNR